MDEKQIRENFASNLSRLRKYNKMSQQELANKLSYSDKAISKWELGDNIPDIFTLERIANLFNVTVDELIKPNISVSKSSITLKKRILITTISSGVGLLLGVIGLLVLSILNEIGGVRGEIIQKFIYTCYPLAILLAGSVLVIFTCIWFEKIWRLVAVSLCIWASAVIAMIWMNFSLTWIVIIIALMINILFAILFKIEK